MRSSRTCPLIVPVMRVEFTGTASPGFPEHSGATRTGSDGRPGRKTGLTVFYDGDCPVCRIEVAYYQRRDKNNHLAWIDITRLRETDLPAGKTHDDLLRRFHVVDEASGVWHVGVDAFAAIWSVLPGFRHFAWLFRAPGFRQCAGIGYRGFLAWQQRHRARRLSAGT